MQCLLLFHGNNGYANAPLCYVDVYISSLVYLKLKQPLGCFIPYVHIPFHKGTLKVEVIVKF
jgi:hypothetical protein